jgi:nitrite reductase (NO-forming)
MQGELYTAGKYHAPGLQTFDMDKGLDEKPTYVLFNGSEGSLVDAKALTARTGDRVRIFIGNGGPNLVSSFHVIGGIFDKVYPEAGIHPQENVQTTLVPAGGAAIVELTFDVPGTYSIVDHSLFRAFGKGAVGQLVVTGPTRHDLMSEKIADLPYDGKETTGGMIVPQISVAPTGPISDAERVALGQATFTRICAACHQPEGQGLPGTFPPLAHSDYLARASKPQLIGHVLRGLQGSITVNGATYNGAMPPMAFLSDDEIAGALTFVRSSWGNSLDAVAPADVAAARSQIAGAP